jgi:phage repressor protein C with HTH and peptisase S24 domain
MDFTHENIWLAIDRLAARFGYSSSGLARQAGLDSTSFNKSKRFSADGKPRWPSTESIARVLLATGAQMSDFLALAEEDGRGLTAPNTLPLIGFVQAGSSGFFDEDGYPAGEGWDEIRFPETGADTQGAYALEISGESMMPLYREGDILVVSPSASLRKGDRVVVRTVQGEVMVKELLRQTPSRIDLKSLNPDHENRTLLTADITWMARVMWVSQ